MKVAEVMSIYIVSVVLVHLYGKSRGWSGMWELGLSKRQ